MTPTPQADEEWQRATSSWSAGQHKRDAELIALAEEAARAEVREAEAEYDEGAEDPFSAVRWDDPEDMDWEPNPVPPAPRLRVVQPTNYRAGIRRDRSRRAA